MQMQMKHRLLCVRTAVEDGAVVAVAQIVYQPFGDQEQVSHQRAIGIGQIIEGWDDFPRNHQQMHRRLGVNVMNGDALLVLMRDLGWDFTGDDALEECHGTDCNRLTRQAHQILRKRAQAMFSAIEEALFVERAAWA